MQTKKMSLIESLTNILIGYCTAILAQLIIFPIFNIQTTIQQDLQIGACFTIVSLIRSYTLRRLFNNIN